MIHIDHIQINKFIDIIKGNRSANFNSKLCSPYECLVYLIEVRDTKMTKLENLLRFLGVTGIASILLTFYTVQFGLISAK